MQRQLAERLQDGHPALEQARAAVFLLEQMIRMVHSFLQVSVDAAHCREGYPQRQVYAEE